MNQNETIVAAATPHGKSALAIVRLSGKDVFSIVSRCIKQKDRFESSKTKKIGLYSFINPNSETTVDEVSIIKYESPKSFTGENMAEIICHGNPRLVEEIVESLVSAGAVLAQRGSFTRRAWEHGKIDLLKAEAIKEMIESVGDSEMVCARKRYFMETSPLVMWKKELLEISALIEAHIEFEDEIQAGMIEKSHQKMGEIIEVIQKDLQKAEKITKVENFLKVVIAGPANAGKSSLFNALIGNSRSIVHDEPGTTRDSICENIVLCGYHVNLVDTAGVRETSNDIEREGIRRTKENINHAVQVIWVTEAGKPFTELEKSEISGIGLNKIFCVINKSDLNNPGNKIEEARLLGINATAISVKNKLNIEAVVGAVEAKLKREAHEMQAPDLFFNKRQIETGKSICSELCLARDAWNQPEIAAFHLKKTVSFLEEFFGKTESEEVVNKIFNTFCIGK